MYVSIINDALSIEKGEYKNIKMCYNYLFWPICENYKFVWVPNKHTTIGELRETEELMHPWEEILDAGQPPRYTKYGNNINTRPTSTTITTTDPTITTHTPTSTTTTKDGITTTTTKTTTTKTNTTSITFH